MMLFQSLVDSVGRRGREEVSDRLISRVMHCALSIVLINLFPHAAASEKSSVGDARPAEPVTSPTAKVRERGCIYALCVSSVIAAFGEFLAIWLRACHTLCNNHMCALFHGTMS